VQVAACPIPASEFAGTPYRPQSPPAMLSVQSSVVPPQGGELFGTVFPNNSASYLVAPAATSCGGEWFSTDAGQVMTAASVSDASEGVMMVLRAGGAGPSTDLACPYIPAVLAADATFRGNDSQCDHPAADVVQPIPSGSSNLYASAVWIPAEVKDSNFGLEMSGNGADPTVALYTAHVTPPGSTDGQMIACTLPPTERSICEASLEFYLATQSAVGMQVGPSDLAHLEHALSTFLDQH